MRYCQHCVLPDTRPGLTFDARGVCSACVGSQEKKLAIPWRERRQTFERLLKKVKRLKRSYDALVPVSGGKDSTWQVVKCLEHDLKVLAVTWKTPGRTVLGQQNLDNLVNLGVDHIDYSIDPDIERRFMLKTLERVGDTAVPMHMALFAIPLRLAVALHVPLVIWGESPHMEYGGGRTERRNDTLDREWLKRHGILHGTSAKDWIGRDLTARELEAYRLPSDKEFQERKLRSIFLGYYLPWDPGETFRVASAHGFQHRVEGPRIGYYNYADIDCDFISVHHHFKWLKFGFTRLFDNLAIEIRNGRLTRDDAIGILAKRGDQTPREDIEKLCAFLRITHKRYRAVEEKFRNRDVWSREKGVWKIKDFIVKDWSWQ